MDNLIALIKRYGQEILRDNAVSELESYIGSNNLIYEEPSEEWLQVVNDKKILYIFIDACRDYSVFKSYGAKNKGQMILKYSFMDDPKMQHIPTVKLFKYFYHYWFLK